MAFLDSVKNLMKFNKNNETKQKNDISTVEKSDLSDKNKEPITKVGHNATLIIIYQDDRGQSLTTPQIISGYIGEELHLRFKEFPNYDLINISGFTSAFVDQYGSITLTYRKHQGADVWLFSQDIDKQKLLMRPVFIRGDFGERFELNAPTIPDYSLQKAVGPTRGVFSDKQQLVTYYYRKSRWKIVDHNAHYLRINSYCLSYTEPEGHDISVTLAPDTIWQTFESIQLINNDWWYNIGGNAWVKFDEQRMELLENNPYTLSDTLKIAPIQDDPELSIPEPVKLSVTAEINFVPNQKLALYDRPFGKKINEIENGKTVLITARNRVGRMLWFEVDGLGWTIWEYLQF